MTAERFTHQGRHLREWLLQLVEGEPERHEAAWVISEEFGFPRRVFEPFSAAAKAVLQEADFPAAEFVKKLLTLHIRLETEDRPEPAKRAPEEEAWLQEMLQKAKDMKSRSHGGNPGAGVKPNHSRERIQ